ncbi:MAG: LPXTG cell wall anchor domain-containing protein [Oscillospiraceae bacterium]|nr:LPXTG cell wall anchor domain-containing protein [Oscillospiraceae bacterium]
MPLNGKHDVEVISKIEPTTPDAPTPTPTTTTTVTTVTDPDVTIPDEDDEVEIEEDEPEDGPEEETLPKTGQLNLPIPIMAGAGGVCIAAGFILTKTDKKR